jgi:hypothetical protein
MWPFRKNERVDLAPGQLEGLSWKPEACAGSLEAVFKHVTGQAAAAINWYLKAKEPKKRWARWLRVSAILAAAIAGIIPMLAQIFLHLDKEHAGQPAIAPAWASVCLALAAAMVALDHFFGFSTAWTRYLAAEMDIRKSLDEYQIDWEAEKAGWGSTTPNADQVSRALARAKAFLVGVDTIVQQETNTWIAEFQSTLRLLDDTAKVKSEVSQLGGANVVVTNGDQCTAGWTLSIDGSSPRNCTGKTAALHDLAAPRLHAVRVEGEIQGNRKQAESVVAITGGSIAKVELTLV